MLATAPPAGATGVWHDVSGTGIVIADTANPNTVVSGLPQQTAVTLSWTVSKGRCSDVDYVKITNLGVTATAKDTTVCDTTALLIANDPASFTMSPAHGKWIIASGASVWIENDTLHNTTINGLPYLNTTTLYWKIYNDYGCSDSTQVSVVNKGFRVGVSGPTEICENDYVTLKGDTVPGWTGLWKLGSGNASFSDTTNYITQVSELAYGVNKVKWIVTANGCSDSAEYTITNNQPYEVRIDAPFGDDTISCDGSVTLQAKKPDRGTGKWIVAYGTGTIANSTATTTTVTGLQPGKNTFEWQVEYNGCTRSAYIDVYNYAVISNAGQDDTVCGPQADLAAVLPSAPGVSGYWSDPSSVGVEFNNSTDPHTTAINLPLGTTPLTWTVQHTRCKATDTVLITNMAVYAQVDSDYIYTCDTGTTLNAYDPESQSAEGYWKSLVSGVTIDDSTQYNSTVHGIPYQSSALLRWVVYNDRCSDSTDVTVVNNGFVVDAGSDQTVCSDTAQLNAQYVAGSDTSYWSEVYGHGEFDQSDTNITVVRSLNPDVNTFRWTVKKNGCTEYADVSITNNEPSDAIIYIKNDTTVCDGQITLRAKSPDQGDGYWSMLQGSGLTGNASTNVVTVTGLSQNNNLFRWTVTKGSCTKYTDVNVINNQVTSNAGPDDTICESSYTMLATAPQTGATGVWHDESGVGISIADTNNPNTVVSNIPQQTTVTLSWTVSNNNCKSVDYVSITNLGVTAKAKDTTVCDTSALLIANDPGAFTKSPAHGKWIIASGTGLWLDNDTMPNTTINGLQTLSTTTLYWKIYNDYGCSDSDQVSVVNKGFKVSISGNPDICDNDYTTLKGDTVPGWTGRWKLASGQFTIVDSTNYITNITNVNYGTNTIRWVVEANGCSDSTEFTINNNQPYPVEIIGPFGDDTITCNGHVKLQARELNAGTGTWKQVYGSGAVIASPNSATTDVTGLSPGKNRFEWQVDYNGCVRSAFIDVYNYGVTSSAGEDDTVCASQTTLAATLPNTQGVSGYWSDPGGAGVIFSNSTDPHSDVSNLPVGITSLTWTVVHDKCYAVDTVLINNMSVVAQVDSDYIYTCDTTATLNAYDPSLQSANGYWHSLISGVVVDNSTKYNSTVHGIQYQHSALLRWIVYNAKCVDSTDVTVVNNGFVIDAGNDKSTCSDTAQLNAQVMSGADTSYWTVSFGKGAFDDTTLANTIVRNLGSGSNIFTWTVGKDGCYATDQVTITNNSITTYAGDDQNICEDSTQLNAQDPSTIGGTGYWTRISGQGTFGDSTVYNTYIKGLRRGSNTLRWTVTANGCTAYDDVVINNNSFDVDAGNYTPVCADTVLLKAQNVEGGQGYWSVQGSSPATIDRTDTNITVARHLQQGTNNFRWTVTKNGCTFYDDAAVVNNLPDLPVIVSPVSPDTVCNSTVSLQAQTPESGVTGAWSYTGSGGNITNSTNTTTTVTDLNPGTTQFIWTVTHNGCYLSTSVTVVNGAVVANGGSDQKDLCQDYASLAAVKPLSPAIGWWSKADGQPGIIADTSDPNTQITNLGYGENKFVWNVKKGRCSDEDTVLIINNSASPAIVNQVPQTCTGEAYLTATAPSYGTGEWSYIGADSAQIESPTSANTKVTKLSYGANKFKWTVTNVTPYATCTSDTTLTVLNYQFTVDAGEDKILCDSVFHLSAQTRPDQDSAKWTVIVGTPTIENTTDPNTLVYIKQGGSAILKWQVWENGCTDDDEITLKNDAVTAVAYKQEVCDTTVNLQAIAPSSGNSGYWSSSYSDISFSPNNSQYNATANGLHPGANQFTWHVYNSHCKDSTSIVVNYLIPYAYAGADQDICGTNYTLGANNPALEGGSGKWDVYQGSAEFDNDTLYNTVVRGLSKGTNILSWTVTVRACHNTDFVTINNLQPTVSVGEDQEICDSTTSLSGNTPDTSLGEHGYWTKITPGPHWFEDSTNPTTKVYGIQPGSEVFRWTIKNGSCEAHADLTVVNNSVVAAAGDDRAICTDSAQLTAFLPSNSTGEWSIVTPGPAVEDSTLYNTWVRHLNFGDNTFKWTVHKGICSSSDLVTITNNAPPVNAGDDQQICVDHTTLFGSLPPSGATGIWRLVGGGGNIVDSTKNVTQVTNLSAGANVLTWTVYYKGCSNTDEVLVTDNELPVDAGADEPALCDDKFELNANPPDSGATGHWQVVAGYGEIEHPDSNITWVRNLARGENVLRWTVSKNGCSNYDEITINNITPTQAITIGTKDVCQDYTTITGNEPRYGVGHWEVVTSSSAVEIDNSLANSTVVRNLAKGPNQFAWVIVDTTTGCSTSDTVRINNNSVVSSAGLDKEICVDTFQLEAVNPVPDSGYWTVVTPGGKIASSDVNNPKAVVRNLPTGANILRWTVYNGSCSAYDDVIITNNKPTQAYAGEDQISCDGNAILLGNTPALDENGLWIRQSGDAIIHDSTSYWTSVTSLSPGKNTFIWKITRGICSSYDTINVVNHNILVDAGYNQTVCNYDTTVLRGNPPSAGVKGYWTLTGGQGDIDNSSSYTTVVRNLGPGSNTFRWTLHDSVCSNYDEVVVVNNTPTQAKVCYDSVQVCEDHTTLCANSPTGIEKGYWTLAAGYAEFENSNSPSTNVYNLSKDVTLLWHISKNGCETIDTTRIYNGAVEANVTDDTLKYCGPDGFLVAVKPVDTTVTRYWELISGSGNIADSTANYTSVSNLALGANIFRWHVIGSRCSAYKDVVVFNNKYPASANLAANNPICDSQVVVMGNPPDAGATGVWSVASGSSDITFDSPNSPTTVVRNLGLGVTSLKWSIIKDGCENYDTVIVMNNSVHANAGNDVTVCDTDETISITANDPLTANGRYGYWAVVSGHVDIADSTAYATTVTHVAYGANTLKWTVVGKGCQDEDQMIVSNNHFTVSAGADFAVCDTTAILTGTDPAPDGTGIWTVSGNGWFENPTSYKTRVNGLTPGSNTYIWTVTKNGCTASDQVVVTNAIPTAFAGGDIAICTDTFQLKATPPDKGSGTWTIVSGGGNVVDPSNPNSVVRDLAKGDNILRWTVRYLTCTAHDDVTVTNNQVTATAGIDQQVCDTVAYMAADPPGPGGHGVWTLEAGGGWFVDSTLFNTAVYGLNDGKNTYRWTVYNNGCENSTLVSVVNNRFSVNAGKDTVVFVPNTTLNADSWSGTFPYSGKWSIVAGGGNFADANSPTTDVSSLNYGVNTYRWFVTDNSTGCTAYDDVNVTYVGLNVNAGADQNICRDSTKLNAQGIPNSVEYWSVVQGGGKFEDPTSPTTKVTDLPRGVNIFRWNVVKNGFATYDEVRVTNYKFDTYAGEDQDLCDDSTHLDAEYMYSYSVPLSNPDSVKAEWQILSGGGNITNTTSAHTSVTDLNPGVNIIRWRVERTDFPGTGVCASSDTLKLVYHKLPKTSFATVPDVAEGCSPLSVSFYNTTPTFDTIPGTEYYWNIANKALIKAGYNDTINRTFVNESKQDSLYPIWLIAQANVAAGVVCRDTAYGQVVVHPVPTIRFTAPIYSVYSVGLQIPIEVSRETDRNCDRYQWDFGDGTGVVSDVLDSSFTHTYNTWGDYTLSLTGWREQCENSYSLTIHIEPPEPVAEPNSTNNAQGCAPLTVPLYAQVLYTTDGVSQYKWIIKRARDTSVVAELHEKDVYYTFTDPGTYLAELWVTAEGTLPEPWSWAFIRTDTIVVFPKPTADFTAEPMQVTVGELVKCFNYSKGATKYFWNFGYPDSTMTSTEFEPTVAYPKEGQYYITLKVESDHYCTDTKTLQEPIVVLQEGELLFPTAFIPTSNIELNRIFKPRYRGEVVDYELDIYDRWGQLIFVSHDINTGWDGTINGKLAPQDVYAYKCDVKFKTGQRKTYAGSVTLLR